MAHDTVAVYTFLQVLIKEHIKPRYSFIKKIIYFSDGSAAQSKNYKNFSNLLHHETDFSIRAEWHFFATSHGKNACDGVGGTFKRLAQHAVLQRPITDQILNPVHLFEFAKNEITGVTCFFVDTSDVEEISPILQPRFTNSPKFKGTRKNHQFIPHGHDIVMKWVSGPTGFETTMIANLPLNGLKIEDIAPGSIYACQYENDWYLGIAKFALMEN